MVIVRRQPGGGVGQGALVDLLEAFGEFAGDQQAPLAAEAGQQVGDAFLDAMGGLVEHQGTGQGAQIVQGLAAGGSPGRQEADEQPGPVQAGNRQGGGDGAGAMYEAPAKGQRRAALGQQGRGPGGTRRPPARAEGWTVCRGRPQVWPWQAGSHA